jgi:hypothetical protein
MLARIGEVLYWAAMTAGALAFVLFAATGVLYPGVGLGARFLGIIFGAIIGLVCWVVGLAIRYLLALAQ